MRSLFDGLARLGLDQRTLIIVTADHGEEFLEHGYVEHAWRLYDESIHVPLIVWAPGLFAPARVSDYVSIANVTATLQELAGLTSPPAPSIFAPEPLFTNSSNGWTISPLKNPVISELHMETRSIVRTIINNGLKYHAAQRWLTPQECSQAADLKRQERELAQLRAGNLDVPLAWGEVVHEELYDLTVDPGETQSLLEKRTTERDAMRKLLDHYRSHCGQRDSYGSAKDSSFPVTAEQAEQLRALGYGGL